MRLIQTTSRYRSINISVLLFVLLITLILGITVYFSGVVAQNAKEIIAVRQLNTLIQTMSRDVFGMKLRYGESPYSDFSQISLKRLREDEAVFTMILNGFLRGGAYRTPEGVPVHLKALSQPEEIKLVQALDSKWQKIKPVIHTYTYTATDINATETSLDLAANRLISVSSNDFPSVTGKLSLLIEKRSEKTAKLLKMMQIIGIIFTVAYFFVFILIFIRRLRESDQRTALAQRETEDIMRTVNEGLFLINQNLEIGEKYSGKLEQIFARKDIARCDLESLLKPLINQNDMQATELFIAQLFKETVVEELIDELNPLKRLKILIQKPGKRDEERWLSFNFTRVYEKDDSISSVLCSVADITQAVLLEVQLESERRHSDEQMQMFAVIFKVNRADLRSFLQHVEQATQKINAVLKAEGASQKVLKEKAQLIFREAHSLKGEASALELSAYVELIQSMEEEIKKIQMHLNIDGQDFLGLIIYLDRLIELNAQIGTMQEQLHNYAEENPSQNAEADNTVHSDDSSNQQAFFTQFVRKIAERNGREVALNYHVEPIVSDGQLTVVKDICLQFIRNAIVHGIEPPEERAEKGKNPQGNIQIILTKYGENQAKLIVEDDGRGIDFAKLRAKAAESQYFPGRTPESLSQKELFRYMFSPGVSTLAQSTEDAGQGIGSDVILERVRSIGGRIGIGTKSCRFTRFTVIFPLNTNGEKNNV